MDTNITELKPSDARCCHKFVSLKILDLSYCSDSVDDATLHDVIINCSRIESLVLSFCHRITDSGIRSVSRLSHLSSLEVADCKLLQDGSLRVLQESVCPLTSIDLTGCDGISAAALEAFLTCCAGRKLRILSLADFSQFTVRDMTLEQIGTMKCLTSLNLANTLGFGDTGMLALAELPMLTHLDMCGCDQISGDSLKNLNGLTGLKFLNLSATRISDGPLRSILAKATSVCSLHISSCEYLSHTTLVELPAAAPGLRELVVANNTFVSDTGVTALARLASMCPRPFVFQPYYPITPPFVLISPSIRSIP